MCPAAKNALPPAGHAGPALQDTVSIQGGQSRPPLQKTIRRSRYSLYQRKEAGASACQLVEKVRMDFFGKLAGKIAK